MLTTQTFDLEMATMRDKTYAVIRPGSGRRRRRSTSADPLKKLTLRMHETVATAVRELVEAGEAPSADAFIEEAVVAQLRELRKARVYAAYAEAAADPVFMAEMEETNRVFEHIVADGLADAER